jgi:outer membrane receptor protein involved in Fe transport
VVYVEPASATFLAPEIILSYETGLKGVLLGGRLNYDLAAYYYNWSHFQSASLRVEEGASIAKYVPDDAGKAHSLGFEAALRYAALPCLSLLGSYAWIDGKFNDTDEEGNPQEYAGHRFRLTPKHTFSMGADFSRRLRGRQSLFFRPAYSYKSKVYFEDNNDERLTQSGYGLLNCTAGFRFEASRNRKSYIEIGVYGKNIGNTKYIIDAGNSGNAIGFPTFVAGSPAVFGGQIRVGF